MMRRLGLALGVVLGCGGLGACGGAPAEQADAAIGVDTVDGIPHVTGGATGSWAPGEAWTVADSGVSIGVVDGPVEYTFGPVSGVAVDPDGRIWIADRNADEIRVFSADGTYLRTIGRDGEGPGEFRDISGLALAPGGVAAMDGRLARVTVFGPEGAVVRSFRLERPYMWLDMNAPMGFDQAGRFFDRARLSSALQVDSIGVISYSAAGEVVDTALVAVFEQDHLLVERDGRAIMSFPRPLAPRPSFAFGLDGNVYLSRGDAYRITAVSPSGDTLRVIRRSVPSRRVTAAERDSAIALIAERYADAGGLKPPPGIELPDRRPAILRLVVDIKGNLWVLEYPDPGEPRMEWSVHDPEGRYLGSVATPQLHVIQIGADFVAGVAYGEMGVPRVRVLPLVK